MDKRMLLMIKRFTPFTFLLFILLGVNHSIPALQNEIRLDLILSPENIDIFNLNDFDLDDASSNPLIFQYRISSSSYPQDIEIELEMMATVAKLDWNDKRILFLRTLPFTLNAPIAISNRVLDTSLSGIIDEGGNDVDIREASFERMDGSIRDDFMVATLMSGGELPAGKYAFTLLAIPQDPEVNVIYSYDNPMVIEILNSSSPVLVSPGGPPEERFTISTRYPIFEWDSEGCEYFIRVSEYNRSKHETPEDALVDVSNLPFPDNGFYFGGVDGEGLEGTTFIYPMTIGKQLEWGKTYVWSVKKVCETTAGPEEFDSDIFAFTVKDERDNGGFFSCGD